jgi:hypothetical protein
MNAKTCFKCKRANFLTIQYDNCNDMSCQWNDNEKLEKHLPQFCHRVKPNGFDFRICIECGWIPGLNLADLRKQTTDAYKSTSESDESIEEKPVKKDKKNTEKESKKKSEKKTVNESKKSKRDDSSDKKPKVKSGSKTNKTKSSGSKTKKHSNASGSKTKSKSNATSAKY